MMKQLVAVIIVSAVAGLLFVVWEAVVFMNSTSPQLTSEQVFEVKPGQGFFSVAEDLEGAGIVSSALYFKILAKMTGQTNRLRVGEYLIKAGIRPGEILSVLGSGKSIERPITFPEGMNSYEMAALLESKGLFKGAEFLRLTRDRTLIHELTGENLSSLEGYLFPETYHYTKYTSAEAMVRAMVRRFVSVYDELLPKFKLKMPRHQLVILASVIEKETGAPIERPLISSVFHNRLQKGMRLQSDPTILYGMLVETGLMPMNIKKSDILKKSPFNTYTVKGLPAGPIGNPGQEALLAAADPANSDFLYFVSRNDGTHVFSKSFDEHNRAVKKFQLDRKARQGKSWRDLKNRR